VQRSARFKKLNARFTFFFSKALLRKDEPGRYPIHGFFPDLRLSVFIRGKVGFLNRAMMAALLATPVDKLFPALV
jgi:hypothetical protein